MPPRKPTSTLHTEQREQKPLCQKETQTQAHTAAAPPKNYHTHVSMAASGRQGAAGTVERGILPQEGLHPG
eukprot:EC689387.1.p4 GENE.EC689387.1~~EC689387.1.p4  ORF type:complete len:71 (+),score=1.02 EC689387.1:201-413(+)